MDAAAVHTVVLHDDFRFHSLSSDGSLVVLDDLPGNWPGSGRFIFLADVNRGVVNTIHSAEEGDRAVSPVIDSGTVAWLDWRCTEPEGNGNLRWSLFLYDQATSKTRIVASGMHVRHAADYCASWPVFAVAGDRLAYAVEDPSRDPFGWKVIVMSIAGNRIEREIKADRTVYDLGVDEAGNVAYTTGDIDPTWGYTYQAALYAARAGADPVKIQDEAYAVSVRDGRIAWEHDAAPPAPAPGATRDRSIGGSRQARAWSASFEDLIPQPVSPGPGLGRETIQRSFGTGNGIVLWSSGQVRTDKGYDEAVNRLCVWRPGADEPFELSVEGPLVSDAGGGWLTWSNNLPEPPTLQGVPLEDLNLP